MAKRRSFVIVALIRLLAALLFVFLSGVIIASSHGYVYNPETSHFDETGLISVMVKQTPVTVTFNGEKKVHTKTSIKIPYVLPGRDTLIVEKDGYFRWEKSLSIHPGEIYVNQSLVLFLKDGETNPATEDQIRELERVQKLPGTDQELDVRDREIWVRPIERTYPFVQE